MNSSRRQIQTLAGRCRIPAETILAAEFWASARQQGRPTAPDLALDADVILAAQAEVHRRHGRDVVIATANVGHLARFTDARHWRDIGRGFADRLPAGSIREGLKAASGGRFGSIGERACQEVSYDQHDSV